MAREGQDPRTYLKLHADFVGENSKDSKYRAVYLNAKQRKKYEVRFIGGKMVDQKGNLLNIIRRLQDDDIIFEVLDDNLNIIQKRANFKYQCMMLMNIHHSLN